MAALEALLEKLDLGKFYNKFTEQDVDLETAKAMSEAELKNLGLTVGAAKKLYMALNSGAAAAAAAAAATPTIVAAPAAASAAFSTKPAATSPSPPAKINPCLFRWRFDSYCWESNGADFNGELGLEIDEGAEPELFITTGTQTPVVNVWSIEAGTLLKQLKPSGANFNERWMSADMKGNVCVQVGGERNNAVHVYDIAKGAQVGVYRGPNEGGLYCVSMINGGSSAAAVTYSGDKAFLYDVATCSPAGKFALPDASWIRFTRRDPITPSCFVLGIGGGAVNLIDTRAKQVARTFIGSDYCKTLRVQAFNGGEIVQASHKNVHVWDYGTGKIKHLIRPPHPNDEMCAAAIYANVICVFQSHDLKRAFYFYDLSGASKEITEYKHDLQGNSAMDMVMASKAVIAVNDRVFSMERS